MIPPPKHASNAERQAAYRRRKAHSQADKAKESGLVPLPAISSIPGTARWRQALAYAAFHAATVRDEMQIYHDERTERWQESERASDFRERLGRIEELCDLLEEIGNEL
jgi:hypothetical protein